MFLTGHIRQDQLGHRAQVQISTIPVGQVGNMQSFNFIWLTYVVFRQIEPLKIKQCCSLRKIDVLYFINGFILFSEGHLMFSYVNRILYVYRDFFAPSRW